MRFVIGCIWTLISSALLGFAFHDYFFFYTVSVFINLSMNLAYFLVFYVPYKRKQRDIVPQILGLISLQILIFLFVVLVFWYYDWPFIILFWTVIIFLGVLFIQVVEQINYLQSVEKINK